MKEPGWDPLALQAALNMPNWGTSSIKCGRSFWVRKKRDANAEVL